MRLLGKNNFGEVLDEHGADFLDVAQFAMEVQVDVDGDGFIKVNPRKVNVDDVVAKKPKLQVLDEARLSALAFNFNVDDVCAVLEVIERFNRVDAHGDGGSAVAVDHGGEATALS